MRREVTKKKVTLEFECENDIYLFFKKCNKPPKVISRSKRIKRNIEEIFKKGITFTAMAALTLYHLNDTLIIEKQLKGETPDWVFWR